MRERDIEKPTLEEFCREMLGEELHPCQIDMIQRAQDPGKKRVAVCWPRKCGRTFMEGLIEEARKRGII